MSVHQIVSTVGAVLGGVIGWTAGAAPPADEASVRALLADVGIEPGADLAPVLRAVQGRLGLVADGVAGPRTVHALARVAEQARERDVLRLAA